MDFKTLSIVFFVLGIAVYVQSRRKGGMSFSRAKISGQFTEDLTDEAKTGTLDPVIGREDEIDRVIHILMRRTKNNPLLIGPAGVGKTAIVEGLTRRIVEGSVPEALKGKRVFALKVSSMLAGTKYRGDMEDRAQKMVLELEKSGRSTILFIDEIHSLVQAKGTEGAVNLSDIFKPALARGKFSVIGATSLKEYDEYIMTDETLERRFQPVMIDEPSVKDAIAIIQGLKGQYESFHGVTISNEAVNAAVKLSHEYIHKRNLPDKAIDLIDEAAAMVKIDSERAHGALGALHAAAKRRAEGHKAMKNQPVVMAQHIREIVEEWVGHKVK